MTLSASRFERASLHQARTGHLKHPRHAEAPLRVILLSHWVTEESGGNGVAAAGYAEALARLGADVHLVTFDGPGGQWIVDEHTAAAHGYALVKLPFLGFPGRARRMLSIVRKLVTESPGPTVVWANGIWNAQSLIAALARLRWRVPYVVHPAGSLGRHALAKKRLKKWAYYTAIEAHIVRNAAGIHCLSEKELAELGAGLRSKAFVVPLGVDPPKQSAPPRHALLVGVLARIHPIKNHEKVLDAVEALIRSGADLRVEFAGACDDGHYERRLRKRIAESSILESRVRLLGHVPRALLADVVGRWRAALLLSEQESFGHAVITAAAVGVPTVVSPGVGVGPALAAAGAGAVAPASDASRALAHLLGADADVLAAKCRRFASQFDWNSCAKALLDRLNSIARSGVVSPPA